MKKEFRKAIIAAGGTGGHIFPALSIARELKNRNVNVLYVGNRNSMEESLARQNNFDFAGINVQKLYRKLTFRHFLFPYKLLKSVIRSFQIIKSYEPDFFIGAGGFVSGPVGFAAKLASVPIFLQEQNSFPGITTKLLSNFSLRVFLGYYGAKKYLSNKKTFFVGNPVNPSLISENQMIDFETYGLRKETKKIFLLGGSQGSVALNDAFLPIAKQLVKDGFELIWQTGKWQYQELSLKIGAEKGIFLFDFTNEIGKIYNSVDLVICRAGAITLAEIELKKIPSIIVPLPTAAENHQLYNALELEHKEIAIVIEQKKLTSKLLIETIEKMMTNYDSYKSNFMEETADNPAQLIVDEIFNQLRGKEC
jgi:UDP-N-acetylglucosamine--N-acetylmuramyl-(pentapeptide) pyrophosphoryl-undecaprenol N-acetylglucosamine transferase